jgi:hypothetical protein
LNEVTTGSWERLNEVTNGSWERLNEVTTGTRERFNVWLWSGFSQSVARSRSRFGKFYASSWSGFC